MVKAYPIDQEGNQTAEASNFSDEKWLSMLKTFGKKIRWAIEDLNEQPASVENIENIETLSEAIPLQGFVKRKPKNKNK